MQTLEQRLEELLVRQQQCANTLNPCHIPGITYEEFLLLQKETVKLVLQVYPVNEATWICKLYIRTIRDCEYLLSIGDTEIACHMLNSQILTCLESTKKRLQINKLLNKQRGECLN